MKCRRVSLPIAPPRRLVVAGDEIRYRQCSISKSDGYWTTANPYSPTHVVCIQCHLRVKVVYIRSIFPSALYMSLSWPYSSHGNAMWPTSFGIAEPILHYIQPIYPLPRHYILPALVNAIWASAQSCKRAKDPDNSKMHTLHPQDCDLY